MIVFKLLQDELWTENNTFFLGEVGVYLNHCCIFVILVTQLFLARIDISSRHAEDWLLVHISQCWAQLHSNYIPNYIPARIE